MGSREGEALEGQLVWVKAAARKLARRAGPAAEWDELYGWGAEGLVEAARSFDPQRGVPFAAYARQRVRGAMLDGMRAMSPLPLAVHRERMEGDEDAGEAHARHCARFASARAEGLLCEVAEEMDGPVAAASADACPELLTARRQLKRQIMSALKALPDAEAEIVRRHALEEEPIERVANGLGIGSERARQLYQRALGRLRSRLRSTAHHEMP
jgi:RNA polymerase sigma factor for flagellar operon FliA